MTLSSIGLVGSIVEHKFDYTHTVVGFIDRRPRRIICDQAYDIEPSIVSWHPYAQSSQQDFEKVKIEVKEELSQRRVTC